jgi:hypothetical protein
MAAALVEAGLAQVEILDWWKKFDLVWARRPGTAGAAGPRALVEVLRCPRCGQVALRSTASLAVEAEPPTLAAVTALRCGRCEAQVPVTPEGVVLAG